MLLEVKAKMWTAEEIKIRFDGEFPTPIMPINDTKGEQDITRVVML